MFMCAVSARSSALTEWRYFEVSVCHDNSHYIVKENCCFIVCGYHHWCTDNKMHLQKFKQGLCHQVVCWQQMSTIDLILCCACNERIAAALLLLCDSQNFCRKKCHVKTISRKYWRIMWKNVFPHILGMSSGDWEWFVVPVLRGYLYVLCNLGYKVLLNF
jgi:hypothetical protein